MHYLKQLWSKPVITGILAVLIVLAFAITIRFSADTEETVTKQNLRSVETTTAAAVAGQQQVTLIGTVRAFTEADITTERAGRITSVNATLGGTVAAGQVIASVENASEQAAVLQAQGAYDAALANASVREVSTVQAANQLDAAETAARNAIQNTYTTVSGAFFTTIDKLYVNPTSPLTTPYFTNDNRSFLRQERVAFQDILPQWQQRAADIDTREELDTLLVDSIEYTERTRAVVDSFLLSLQERDSETFNGEQVNKLITEFSGVRNSLAASGQALRAAQTNIRSAEQSLEQAEITSRDDTMSVSGAQVTQALGSLRAAQANLAKTVFRSPIAGTVNRLNVQLGDFVGSFDQIAVVANNSALEVVTFVGDLERDQLEVGDELRIDGIATGTITTIAPGIDAETRKTEVRVATESDLIDNGDTVRMVKAANTEERLAQILIPLSAVKFEATDGFVMQVSDESVITQKVVTLGPVRGDRVAVLSGLDADETFIKDVRGLTPGTSVTVEN